MMDNANLLGMLRQWWLLLLCGAVIGGGAGALISSAATPSYSADVKFLVGPISADFDDMLRASGQLARTYSELATSRRVLNHAIRETGLRTTALQLQEDEVVQARSNDITRIVTIEAELEDAVAAARLVNAIARRIGELAAVTPRQETATMRRLLTQDEISQLSGPDQDAVAEAVRRVLGTSSLSGRVEIIQPAEVPLEPVSPNTILITILAALMGMLAVAVLIVLRESLRRGVSDERTLGALEAPPFLGTVEVAVARDGAAPLAVESESDEPVEAYRALAAKIGFLDNHIRVRTLLIVDAAQGKQAGIVAANLAALLADTQRSVLLVDANELAGSATTALGLDGQPGYGELTTGLRDATLFAAIEYARVDQFPTLAVIPRGATPVADRLDEDFVERILLRFRAEADIIVISGAPVHLSPAALFWARAADGTLMVVAAGGTSLERVQEALRSLSFAAGAVVGTVLGRTRRFRGLALRRRTTTPVVKKAKAKVKAAAEAEAEAEPEAEPESEPDPDAVPEPEAAAEEEKAGKS
jgi:capsular polysaccharide biosynthesis protein/Mrp family chromosome partitioning ATPase